MSLTSGPVRSGIIAWMLAVFTAHADPLPVPNGSFESPEITFVGLKLDSWQKNPKAPGFVEDYEGEWDTLVGVYDNPAPESAEHIDNMDGTQAIFVFAVPGAGLSLDYHSKDNFDDVEAPHEFDVRFAPGLGYRLTVGVIGGGGGRGTPTMKEGATLELSLYCHDDQTNVIQVASSTVSFSAALFPSKYHFLDFHVDVPTVSPEDLWAGRRIGIGIHSTVSDELQGSYWDVDNVRLTTVTPPSLQHPVITGSGIQFDITSAPGLTFDLLASPDPTLPVAHWSAILSLTNATGTMSVTNGLSGPRQFYQLRQQP